ncbi:MAG: calcium/sodium antiporter [Pseudomonadota bacterium]
MLLNALHAAGALVLLCIGGDLLVRGASALAERLGVSALAIGLTVVAFGTSAPELAVSLDAARAGATDISIGNVVGSNTANIALILGLALLFRPVTVQAQIVKLDAPLLLAATVVFVALLMTGGLGTVDGLILVSVLAGYTVFTFRKARLDPAQAEFVEATPTTPSSLGVSIALTLGGLLLLIGGGRWLVAAAVDLATALGVSNAVIGLTIVALGTSLPELATSVVATARGKGDIAIGGIIGSNLFNLLGIAAVTAVFYPLSPQRVLWIDVGVMLALTVALMLVILRRRPLGRGIGIAFVTTFVAYSTYLFLR